MPLHQPFSPGQLAHADRQLASASTAVDQLLAGSLPDSDDRIVLAIDLVGRIAIAAARLDVETGGDASDIEAPILAIAAELLRRALTTTQGASA